MAFRYQMVADLTAILEQQGWSKTTSIPEKNNQIFPDGPIIRFFVNNTLFLGEFKFSAFFVEKDGDFDSDSAVVKYKTLSDVASFITNGSGLP